MKNIFLSGLHLLFAGLLLGQNGTSTFEGRIIEAAPSARGVSFALIQADDAFTYSDLDGFFEITLAKGQATIEVSQLGYETTTFELSSGQDNYILPSSPILLEQVLVSSTLQYSQPQSDTWIDPAQQITQARDIGDLFRDIPGFGLSRKGGFAVDPTFRGFKYEQLNVIYDGGAQTTYACPGRMDPATTHINPQEVEKIEVIRGPFSVRYGPTTGAVINIVTEGIPRSHDRRLHGAVQSGYETNGNTHLGQLQLNRSGDKVDFAAGAGWKEYGSYVSGDGTQIPSSFSAYDYNLKTAYRPDEQQLLQMSWRSAFHRDVLHSGLAMDTDSDDSHFLTLDYRRQQLTPFISQLRFKAYATQVDHVMTNARRPNFMMVEAVADVQANTYGAQVELSLNPKPQLLIYTGLDYRGLKRSGDRTRLMKRNMMTGEPLPMPMTMVDAIWQDARINQAGAFAEARYYFDPQWTFLAGMRLDRIDGQPKAPAADFFELYDGNIQADVHWNYSATAALSHQMNGGWNMQLAIGRGVRSPNMIERYINHFTVGQDAYEYVGNPHLKPEANHQIEWSTEYQHNHWQAGVNIFYARIGNYIMGVVDTNLNRKFMGSLPYARRFTNLDQVEKFGTEFNASCTLHSNWSLSGTLAYTWAQDQLANEPLAEISPLAGTIGLRHERAHWWVQTDLRIVGEQNRVSQRFDEQTTPGFSTLDLRLGTELIEGLSLGVAVLNVFDTNYREHLNRSYRNSATPGIILEPGRNITFFGKYAF